MKKRFTQLMAAVLMLLTMVGLPTKVWADEVTLTSAQIKAGTGNTSYGNCSATDEGGNTWQAYAIKNQHSNATSAYNFWQIKKYASNTAYYVQVPELGTQITSITMTVSSSSQPMTGGSNSATLYFSSSSSTSSTGTGVASGTGANLVTIDCSSLNLNTGYITASGAVRIWNVTVTYTAGGGSTDPSITISGDEISNNAVSFDWNSATNNVEYTASVAYNNMDTPTSSDAAVGVYTDATCQTAFSGDYFGAFFGEDTETIEYAFYDDNPSVDPRTVYMRVEVIGDEDYIPCNVIAITQAGKPQYTVTYNGNGADTGTVPTDSNSPYVINSNVTVLGNTGDLAKTGHTFSGWCLDAGCTGTVYGPGYTTTYQIAGNTTFYAKWTKNQYNVALNNNDKATLTATYGTSSTITEGGNANVDYGTVITLNATGMTTGAECVWQIKKASDNSDVTSSVLSNGNKLTVPDYAVIIDASISTKAVYTITSTSAVSSSGAVPSGSSAIYTQTHNTASQMTSGNSMTLTLKGYEGQMIKAITLSMKSNKSSGAGYMTATAGTTTIGSIASEDDPKPFSDAVWNRSYSTDYVNITVPIANPDYVVLSDLVIYIKASENSLYCQSFTIYYETSTDPIVVVNPSSIRTNYEEHNNVSGFTIQSVNIANPSCSLEYCDAEGNSTTKPDWFTAALNGTSVSYSTTQNDGPDRYAYFKIHESTENVYSDVISFRQVRKLATYKLVSEIEPGKHYIFASAKVSGTGYGMSSQGVNNRGSIAVDITADGDDIIISEDADGSLHEFVISGNGTNPNYYTIYDVKDSKYLYAASSSNNYLKSQEINDSNGEWSASFDSDSYAVTFTAQGENTRNTLSYNSSSKIFSCYSEAQQVVYLYVKVNDTNYDFYSNTTSSAAIASGETYTVHSPATLTLNNVNNGSLIIEEGGQLITGILVAGTVQKNITAYTSDDDGWNLISSPVRHDLTAAGIGLITETTYDLYYLEEPTTKWINFKSPNGINLGIDPQKGYLYANAANTTLSFSGGLQPNVENGIEVSLSKSGYGWNLVGNPFPFNAYVNKPYYVINGRTVEAYTGSDPVPTCTGIIVKATEADEKVTFRRTTFTDGAVNNGNIQMSVAQQATNRGTATTVDNAIVSFNEGSQLEKFYFGTQNANLYIPQGTEEYAIVSSNGQGEMPVNFKANEDGQYTLTVNPEGVEMNYLHLIDNMTGADVDLLALRQAQGPASYTFNAKTTDYESRFRLVFAANSNNEDGPSTGSGTFAFFSNGSWIINNPSTGSGTGEATLQVIDINGRILSSETINGSVSKSINATTGIYMMRLISGDNVKTQKVVVK